MKKVQVQMTDECHTVLKAYAAFFGVTMSDILYQFTRQEVQHHALNCKYVQQLLDGQDIRPDKRVNKDCWGHKCLVCNHRTPCRAGLTDEMFSPKEEIKQYLKEDSSIWSLYNN